MKISIVTPTYNSEAFLTQTIESVLSQKGDFEIEYIIVDGGSNDSTVALIEAYELKLKNGALPISCNKISLSHISEKDRGMYDAINKGFLRATGDICAWINSDDYYEPDAFNAIQKAFSQFPEIEWLKGITSFVDEKGEQYQYGKCYLYNRPWITLGIYGRNAVFIHQEGVFWRKELWQKAGPLKAELRYAGDYDLWIKFARESELWSLNQDVAVFRKRRGQLTSDMSAYRKEQKDIAPEAKLFTQGGLITQSVKLFFWLQSKRPQWLHPLFLLFYRMAFRHSNRYVIEMDADNNPFKKQILTYIASKR